MRRSNPKFRSMIRNVNLDIGVCVSLVTASEEVKVNILVRGCGIQISASRSSM
jgi:hypothetical protein